MAILVPLSLLLFFALFAGSDGSSRREALVRAYLCVFAFVLGVTEAASLFHALSFRTIAVAWWLLAAALAVTTAVLYAGRRNARGRAAVWKLGWLVPHEPLPAALLTVVFVGTLATALLYPPNTWDSMTYHMARVVHWMQNGGVQYYPTAIARQNVLAPLAEYAILHLQVLSNGDLFANCVQWTAGGVCVALASLIAAELGGGRRAQTTAALFACTIPMVVLQSSSTQNDLVVAFFCLAFAFYMMRFLGRPSAMGAILGGLALGLALMTKGSAYVYGAAIGSVWGGVWLLRAATTVDRLRRLGILALVALLAVASSTGYYARNMQASGEVLASGGEQYCNDRVSGFSLFHNLVLNIAAHAATPWPAWNRWAERTVRHLLGDRLLDQGLVWHGSTFGVMWSRHEDLAGNPIHLLLACLALASVPWLSKKGRGQRWAYAAMLVATVVLWCLVLRWQPWTSRLQTPWFLLAAPLVGVVLERFTAARPRVFAALWILLFLGSLPFLVRNASRPLDPRLPGSFWYHDRAELYFNNRPELYQPYTLAVSLAMRHGGGEFGLCMDEDDCEYPLWVLAGREKGPAPVSFHHVFLDSATGVLTGDGPLPDCIFLTRQVAPSGLDRAGYVLAYDSPFIRLFCKP